MRMHTNIGLPRWEELVEEHYLGIYHYACRFLGSRAEAEDVTQVTFLSACQRLEENAPMDKIRSWFFTIARNKCIDRRRFWRRWRSRPPSGDEQSPAPLPEPLIFIQRLLQKLPRRQREIFILRHWHGFSTRETAEILAINEGTVKSHLIRATRALKALILEGGKLSHA